MAIYVFKTETDKRLVEPREDTSESRRSCVWVVPSTRLKSLSRVLTVSQGTRGKTPVFVQYSGRI